MGGIPSVSTRFSLSVESEQADAGRDYCRTRGSRETKFSGANGDREIYIFAVDVQLTTSRMSEDFL